MLQFRASLAFVLCAAMSVSTAFAASVHRSSSKRPAKHGTTTSTTSSSRSKTSASSNIHGKRGTHKAAAKPRRPHGQQAIDTSRVTEIQQALIREHYYSGEANGQWDEATKAAMQKYQADQGWQTKLMPDSRALKKLGLGPDYSGAINAKSATFAVPPAAGTTPPVQAEGFAEAAGVKQ